MTGKTGELSVCEIFFIVRNIFPTVPSSWFRSPVHWAVLHGKVGALQILLEHGCTPVPPKPKGNSEKRTSGAIEYPREMCDRIYGDSEIGKQMAELLDKYSHIDVKTESSTCNPSAADSVSHR